MANKKITELTEETSPVGADLLPLVDDVSGTPTTKKVTVSNLMTLAPVQSADISGLATQVSLGNHEALTSAVHGISAFGATLVDDADASAARTTLGLGTAATSASTDFYPSALATTSYTASGTPLAFTLTSAANNKVVTVNETNHVYVTVPTGLGAGFNCSFVQLGAGQVIVQAGAGAVVGAYTPGSTALNTTAGQYAALNLIATSTDNYVVWGESTTTPFTNSYSVSMAGDDDYVNFGTIPQFASVSTFSVAGWFKTNTSSRSLYGGTQHYFYPTSSGFSYRINNQTATIGAGTNYADDSWYHFVLTYNSGTVAIYINGNSTPIGTSSIYNSTTNSTAGDFFRVGARAVSGGNPSTYFAGNADEIAIWDSVIGSSEVSDIYASNTVIDLSSNSGNYTSSSNLKHWWRFGDGDSGSTVNDKVISGGVDGTLTNGASFSTTTP